MSKCIYTVLFILFLGNHSLFAQANNKMLQTCRFLFRTTVNGSSFSFDSVYQNHFDEAFKVRSFKYYVSHIRLVYDDGNIVSSQAVPHLINEVDSTSKEIRISAPKGTIKTIHFLLGIDSATNVSGVQSGALDPAKGMFWIWNTGYIMAKLEGSSSSSKAPAKQYSYDIGGYKPGENAAREITLSVAVGSQSSVVRHQQPMINHQLSSTNKQQAKTFLITADISKWFYGKNDIQISSQPMCHSPGTLAMQVADNYAGMFSLSVQ